MIIVAVFAGFIALLLGAKVAAHKTPPDVKSPSLVLQAMSSAKCVGDVWGFDVYLARKNTELLSQAFPKTKVAMVGLFAEKILQTAPWERPLDDLKYSFYVLRQEKIRRLSETTVFLIRLKEILRDFWIKGEPLDPKETLILESLREEERQSSSAVMERRYQELLWKNESDSLKARLLIREASLEEQRMGQKTRRKTEQIKVYEKKGVLPFYLVLTARELRKGPPLSRELLEVKKRKFLVRESEDAMQEYQKALEVLPTRDYKGFVAKAEKMASNYSQKDFGPVLLYQAWSVAHYDLGDPVRAEKLLSKLKKEYPVSDWAYPEKAPKFLTAPDTKKAKKDGRSGLGKFLLPLNLFRGFFKKTTEKVFLEIKEISDGLTDGGTHELILDEKSAENYFEPLLPSFIQETLRGYQLNLTEEGMDVFVGVKIGIFNIVFSGRGALVAEEEDGARTMRLRLREIKVQGVPVPCSFLRQIENDFEEAVKNEDSPMELVEAKYWRGGAKIVFKKKASQKLIEKSAKSVSGGDLMEKKTDE